MADRIPIRAPDRRAARSAHLPDPYSRQAPSAPIRLRSQTRDFDFAPLVVADDRLDTVTIDNFSASYQVTNYLIDLGHTRIGAITGSMHSSTGKACFEGLQAAMSAKGISLDPLRPNW
jgi:DNA-binding LacI/PurR family transcriptional regulator